MKKNTFKNIIHVFLFMVIPTVILYSVAKSQTPFGIHMRAYLNFLFETKNGHMVLFISTIVSIVIGMLGAYFEKLWRR